MAALKEDAMPVFLWQPTVATSLAIAFCCSAWPVLAGGGKVGPIRLPSAQEVGTAVEQGVNGAGKAAADVITLGQTGRDRDAAAAEAREREAQQARANAEAQRQQKITDVSSTIRLLESIVKSYDENQKLIGTLKGLHEKILIAGTVELEDRSRSMALFERLRDSQRKQSNDLKDLVEALSRLKVVDQDLYRSVESKDAPIVDVDKGARVQAVSVARRILDTAVAEGETSAFYLSKAAEQLQTESLRSLVATSAEAKTILVVLEGQVAAQRTTYVANLDGKKKELAELGPA